MDGSQLGTGSSFIPESTRETFACCHQRFALAGKSRRKSKIDVTSGGLTPKWHEKPTITPVTLPASG